MYSEIIHITCNLLLKPVNLNPTRLLFLRVSNCTEPVCNRVPCCRFAIATSAGEDHRSLHSFHLTAAERAPQSDQIV